MKALVPSGAVYVQLQEVFLGKKAPEPREVQEKRRQDQQANVEAIEQRIDVEKTEKPLVHRVKLPLTVRDDEILLK